MTTTASDPMQRVKQLSAEGVRISAEADKARCRVKVPLDPDTYLILMTDGACKGNPGLASTGWVLWNRNSDVPIATGGRALGATTNNVAEYEALIEGLEECVLRGAKKVCAYTDSDLVFRQVTDAWKCKDGTLANLRRKVLAHMRRIGHCEIRHCHRQLTHLADRAARRAGQQITTDRE